MDPAITIDHALVREAEQILKLQYLCYQSEAALYNDYTLAPLTQAYSDLLASYDSHCLLVARSGTEVIGSVRGQQREGTCHVGRLIVHPRFRGQGLGTRLMQALEEQVKSPRYELFTGHLSAANLRLYQRLGYHLCREEVLSSVLRLIYLEKIVT